MENKINIAKKIIEQSPPSEIKDIFEDLKGLVDIPNLDELLQDSFKSYNENQFNNVLINNNKDNCLLSQFNKIDEDYYLASNADQLVKVDHFNLVPLDIIDDANSAVHYSNNDSRLAVKKALDDYVKDFYVNGFCDVFTKFDKVNISDNNNTDKENIDMEKNDDIKVDAPQDDNQEENSQTRNDSEEQSQLQENIVESDEKPLESDSHNNDEDKETEVKEHSAEGDKIEEEEEDTIEEEKEDNVEDDKVEENNIKDEKVEEDKVQQDTPQVEKNTQNDNANSQQPLNNINSDIKLIYVGNKYSQSNYWSGKWKAQWDLNISKGELKGKIDIIVHYFENGNVQLHATHEPTITINIDEYPKDENSIKKLINSIKESDKQYQVNLNDIYEHKLGNKVFKSLRRILPITREKVDWDKVVNYKLGSELGKLNNA